MINNKIKIFLNIFGFCCLIGAVFVSLLTFFAMTTFGFFLAYEPIKPILYFEVFIFVYGAIYLAILIQRYVLSVIKKKEKVSVNLKNA